MPKAETITSTANPLLKDVRRAVTRGGLTSQGWCVAETFHLLEEAVRSGCEVRALIAAESAMPGLEARVGRLPEAQLAVLPDREFQQLAATETSQGVMALVEPPQWTLAQIMAAEGALVLLDGLQDPGNAGAIVRAAEAFGAAGVVFLKGTVSPFNPKTVRATAGSLFRVPLLHALDAATVRAQLGARGDAIYASVPARPGVRAAAEADLTVPCALVIGGEARGVGAEWRSTAHAIAIPTTGVESLNAAMAAGILLYEARRQRAARP